MRETGRSRCSKENSLQNSLQNLGEGVSPMYRKILIVDDNDINREILCRILKDEYEVLEAVNGQEALEILNQLHESISAVLLDLVMPVMNGYKVLEHMREDPFLSKIPVIVATGDDAEDAEMQALTLGAHDFIIKPYKPAIIKQRLRNTINLRETAAFVNAVERDELTGIYSKEFFYKKAEAMLKDNPDQKYDIICGDIERFKLVNELFGVKTGNQLLQNVAQAIRYQIGTHGICGRIGADLFACMVKRRKDYSSETFAFITESIDKLAITITVNVSYGIYQIEDTSLPVSIMCDRALIACNSVKGIYDINYAFYNDQFMKNMRAEQIIIDNMKTALKERQFIVYYQPKYDLSSERPAGAEALVRWIHPELGFMPPNDFIPLFERNGFITDLDVYVWDTACRDMSEWIAAGYPPIPISVNVSRADIYNPNLTIILMDMIHKYNLKPEYLHLEITETAYTESSAQLINVIGQLKSMGFLIEMDDFGSGYSSLNMLAEISIDILKLDRGFIQNETTNERSKGIISFVMGLAKWLKLPVVAEGVETEEQIKTLKTLGCDYVQGYYYAKPMPKADFERHVWKAETA